jgi:hypothetical protein
MKCLFCKKEEAQAKISRKINAYTKKLRNMNVQISKLSEENIKTFPYFM